MRAPSALVLDSRPPATIGGLTLTERSVIHAHRAGCDPIAIWGAEPVDPRAVARLASRGVPVRVITRATGPLADAAVEAAHENGVVVIGSNVLIGSTSVLRDLVAIGAQREEPAVAGSTDGWPLALYVPARLVTSVAADGSVESMLSTMTRTRPARTLRGIPMLRRLDAGAPRAAVERDLIRHLNGDESFFTKNIRRFSVPLSTVLTRAGLTPTQVTVLGLVLSILSAWCIAQGQYLWGVAGGLLCYASMVLDCSDGEVARLSLRDSAFGAWLETVVDYTTYMLLLGALAIAVQGHPHEGAYLRAAAIALTGSLVVVAVAMYLRAHVAGADPGQFDEASAHAMGSNRFHRFARWSRQWIKRSSIAHLVLALALVDALPFLLYLWAFGATASALVFLAVEPFVARRVRVKTMTVTPDDHEAQGVRSCP